jgi:hypothetical protein
MTILAHCLKKTNDGRWVPAGGLPFRDRAGAEAWAAESGAVHPLSRVCLIKEVR